MANPSEWGAVPVETTPSGPAAWGALPINEAPEATPSARQRIGSGVQEIVPSIPETTAKAGEVATDVLTQGKGVISDLKGQAPEIDYESGAPFPIRVMLQRAANPEEAKLTLAKYYKPGEFGQDEGGRWWVNQDGKKTSVMPSGTVGSAFQNFGADMLATSGPMAGALTGAAIGQAAIPIPVAGGVIGAGIGAGVGYGADQIAKYMMGTYAQTPAELTKHVANEAALNTALWGAGPLLSKAGSKLAEGFRWWTGVTPETKAMTGRLVNEGAIPPIASVAPDAKAMQYDQMLRNMIAGNPQEKKNILHLQGKMKDILVSEGIPEVEATAMMQKILDRSSAVTGREAGQEIMTGARQHIDLLNTTADVSIGEAKRLLSTAEKNLTTWANQPVGRLAEDVASSIVAQRREFSQKMSNVYKSVDVMAGDKPVFPLAPVIKEAQRVLELMPETFVPPAIKNLAMKPLGSYATFAEAHNLRSVLREATELTNLTPGMRWNILNGIEDAVDHGFTQFAKYGTAAFQQTAGMGRFVPKEVTTAAQALKKADAAYREGIVKYKDATVNKLVRDVRSGMIPDPESVASTILREGRVDATQQIMRMLPPEVREATVRADMRGMIRSASTMAEDGTMRLDGKRFLDILDDRKNVLGAIYPPQMIDRLRGFSKQIAALNGKIDVTTLQPSHIKEALERGLQAQRELDAFARGNPLAALTSGKADIVDRAAAYVIQPGKEARTEEVMKFFGSNSREWAATKKYALTDLLTKAIVETPSLNKTIAGSAINKELSRYTAKQQQMLFPGGLADDMRELAKEARFLFPWETGAGGKDLGASLAAATIKGKIPFNPQADYKWLRSKVIGFITDRPALLRVLAETHRSNPSSTRQVLGVLSNWIINSQTMGPGDDLAAGTAPPPVARN